MRVRNYFLWLILLIITYIIDHYIYTMMGYRLSSLRFRRFI